MEHAWARWTLVIVAFAFLLTSIYGYREITGLHAETVRLQGEIQKTNSVLSTFAETTKDSLTQLDTEIGSTRDSLTGSITGVQDELDMLTKQSEQQFAEIGGNLNNLQQENQAKFDSLEQSISLSLSSSDFSGIIEDVVKSVVSIQTDKGLGSGVFVRNDGYLVTNYHVIQDATAAAVITHDQERHSVTVVGAAPDIDIAVLKIDATYPALEFANINRVVVGQRVIALGNPGGLQFSVTEGIVSAINRQDESGNIYVQTDVPINPGNSGGPLVDATRKIVGINTKKVANYEGIGFAIPSNIVEDAVEQILAQVE